jgi:hypothetical protein
MLRDNIADVEVGVGHIVVDNEPRTYLMLRDNIADVEVGVGHIVVDNDHDLTSCSETISLM